MKILSLYIENYGALSEKHYEFEDGLTVFCEENGYGKTTLASFIKAMFYGLPAVTKVTKDFSDRKHFYPFGGGKFGGNLLFEADGKRYRIERFFDRSKKTQDSFRLFCNDSECDEFDGENVGQAFFGLDEESFARTLFIDSTHGDFTMTADIGAALNRFVDDTDDDLHFEGAMKLLEKKRKELKADRGNKGLIADKDAKIRALEQKIEGLTQMQRELEARYLEREAISKNIAADEGALIQAKHAERWAVYDEKLNELSAIRAELLTFSKRYQQGLPDEAAILSVRGTLEALAGTLNKLEEQSTGEGAAERYEALTKHFLGGIPTEAQLNDIESKIGDIARLEGEVAAIGRETRDAHAAALVARLDGKMPTDNELEVARKALEANRQSKRQAELKPSKSSIRMRVLLATGIGCLLCGLAFLFVLLPLGIALSLLGAGVCALGLGMSGGARRSVSEAPCDTAVREFLERYGYLSEAGIEADFLHLTHDLDAYDRLLSREREDKRRTDEKKETIRLMRESLNAFFAEYRLEGGDAVRLLSALRAKTQDYLRLGEEKRIREARKAALEEESRRYILTVQEIFSPYGIEVNPETLRISYADELLQARRRMNEAALREKELQTAAENYRQSYALDERVNVTCQDSSLLEEKLSEQRRRFAVLERQILHIEYQLEELVELENGLERLREEQAAMKYKHRLLAAAESLMRNAEQSLLDRYVAPIKDSFCRYAESVSELLGEKITMDKSFSISFEKNGELHSQKHLSAGQLTLLSLCLRLSLIDNIYGEKSPFLVLDDPFVHLDETHLKKALATLKLLAEEKQMIYFTCHESRADFS